MGAKENGGLIKIPAMFKSAMLRPCRALMLSLPWLLVGQTALAMGWFNKEPKMLQTELSAAELQKLSIQSGWSNDDPKLMMFEVGNQLSGPIFCTGASFEFKDGKKRNQAFEPKLYIPSKNARRVSVRDIDKQSLKTFGFSCLCMKYSPTGPCEDPFKK
jgi:hypothetical protein